MQGVDEAVLKNIEAVRNIAEITRTSLGPNGMNKIIINHIGRQFVTSDAATIIRELEVVHPAAKILVMASQRQETEFGDATNLVLALGGELMQQAEQLLRMGLHVSEVVSGFVKAGARAQELLERLECRRLVDIRSESELTSILRTVIASKQYGNEDILTPLVARACLMVLPRNPENFSVESVRTAKIIGGALNMSTVVKGVVVMRDTEGNIKHGKAAKVAVFQGGIEAGSTETKGQVVLTNATELMNYNKTEEEDMEKVISGIAETGVKAIVCGASISEMAMHFIERYRMIAVKILSKFELRRLCKTVGATPLVRMGVPTPEELGFVDSVSVEEIGSNRVTIFDQDKEDSRVATIVLRGASVSTMEDVERSVDDAVNAVKTLAKDPRLCAGGGATEMELACQLRAFANTHSGLEQYAMIRYAEAFEIVAHILAENAGQKPKETISSLYAAHSSGQVHSGVNIEDGGVADMVDHGIFDLLASKMSAIKLATDAVATILRVDQIIMMKQAGGPVARDARTGQPR
eukprot:gnl/Spiro4/10263_TR5456_c0_g1_i1.p2 gnl/Spiro4/10263_TR5456_c0_g1~~gnl/Spiro4/10263_TR5456_c0_g1_i1.p2  ORF type:complete len:558 (-),score=146.29 gnl/Spiro4/10263_TR5456_c0_g1_i1:95-1663(-)